MGLLIARRTRIKRLHERKKKGRSEERPFSTRERIGRSADHWGNCQLIGKVMVPSTGVPSRVAGRILNTRAIFTDAAPNP